MIHTLIVDDERLFRESLKSKIEKFNDFHVIATAKNGLDGQLEIKKNPPHVIFSDVRMPGQDGLQFLSEVRNKFGQDIIVIFISGYPNFEYAKRALQLGAFDYMTKPILEDELFDVINRIREKLSTIERISYEEAEDIIGLAKEWIHNHIKDATLNSTATYVRMNPSSFSRKFRQETGITFIQYLTETRLDVAKKLLKNPIIKINEISLTVGYSDYQHFSRTFKKHIGLSPEDFRSENLK